MNTIKLSPKKLDALADKYFASVKAIEDFPSAFDNAEAAKESDTIVGIALRRWAVQMREEAAERKRLRKMLRA